LDKKVKDGSRQTQDIPFQLGIHFENIAYKTLALPARQIPNDWQKRYHHRPLLLEALIEKVRFFVACYRMANKW